ncbi:MAG TPA: NAD(P)/FAD-dependent oxidoreductase [Candidatus Eremiobacteraceae bacterium]|nr:NAD(P)/FAD-dependent oxidoreductase [Candidatus Eremiobacteraceae bacterium]
MKRFQVAIVGGGVAGLSAALFLARAGISVAVFDQHESSLYRVSRVHNYLGFPDGIPGPELIELGRRQATRFGAELFDEDVEAVANAGASFSVRTGAGAYEADYAILASNKRTDIAHALGLELGGFGNKFVSVDSEGRTAVDRLYAAGRITGLPSQASISAGDGAKVAIAIIQRMRGGYYVDHDT